MSRVKQFYFLLGVIVFGIGTAPMARAGHPALFSDITLGEPTYAGTGCPQGTAQVALSPQRRWLAVGFAAYTANAESSGAFARESCGLAIPVSVPPGLRVSLSRLRAYGDADIPSRGRGTFRAEYFFTGSTGATVERDFRGGFDGSFVVRGGDVVRSGCGESGILRVNTSIRASNGGRLRLQFLTLDVRVERCD